MSTTSSAAKKSNNRATLVQTALILYTNSEELRPVGQRCGLYRRRNGRLRVGFGIAVVTVVAVLSDVHRDGFRNREMGSTYDISGHGFHVQS
ncbi:hypothetical protein [Haladaptatus sp. DYF46]|uniref:hypothetical protein n=1 Tax=Haladaptatus sp. DYF46 TaxID=2886041 RepID=UPI001E623F66|nr:hypothetical protein [Haladaptatus sp. DYF46]